MEIYVVKPGDTLESIAQAFGTSAVVLQQKNDLINPESLVPGQTIVIVFPEQTYVVQEGDTVGGIAAEFGITVMQLLRNNPFLSDREYIYPGETLVISYDTGRKITTIGYAYPYINKKILQRTLPFLTYLTVFNYMAISGGEITEFEDDTEIIRTAKEYGTIPLMMASTLTAFGEPNIEVAYEILLNESYQERVINNLLAIMNEKGYSGLNMTFYFITQSNQRLYEDFIAKVSSRVKSEGYLFFVSINPNIKRSEKGVDFEKVDYSKMSQSVDNITFLNFIWGTSEEPPSPISSISNMRTFLDYIKEMVPANLITIGTPVIGYNWELPFIPGRTQAVSLTLNSAISLAYDVRSNIQFDDVSQTPFYQYIRFSIGLPNQHIVWFIDARTINAILGLITEYGLQGSGIWNIMIYYPQLWLEMNSQFDIEKVLT